MSYNRATLVGRLGRDPEIRVTQSDKSVTSFSLATNERWKSKDGQDKDQTTWHNIVVWDPQAKACKEYLQKGSQVLVEGRIVNRSYQDKDGNTKWISEVVAQRVVFLGSGSAPAAKEPERGDPGAVDYGDCPF